MSKVTGPLGKDEAQQIIALVDRLERTEYDYVQLQIGDLKLTLSKGGSEPLLIGDAAPGLAAGEVATVASGPAASAAPRATGAAAAASTAAGSEGAQAAPPAAVATQAPAGTVAIPSPMVGKYYAQPEPGAPPFVNPGQHVDPGTTVALIEVMKVFSAARAGISGVIVVACVQDGDFVEFGQPLYWVRPD